MNQIYQDYRDYIGPDFKIVLFSGSTDGNDINTAGSFVRNNMAGIQFSVVALSHNGGIWNNFPYSQLYLQHPSKLTASLGTCLVSNSCGTNGKEDRLVRESDDRLPDDVHQGGNHHHYSVYHYNDHHFLADDDHNHPADDDSLCQRPS